MKTARISKLVIVLIALLIFCIHGSYINNGFVWLDHGDIEGTRALVPLGKLYLAFLNRFGETGFYRPLVTVMHLVDALLYGPWAPGFHITNILLHVAAAMAAPLFISTFIPLSVTEYYVIMLVFGLHPVSWLPVGAISYRQEMLVSLFTYLSLYFHARARVGSNALVYILSVICILLALFSKETALFWIPAYIFLWEMLQKKHTTQPRPQRNTLWLAEVFAIVFYIILRLYAVPEIWKSAAIPMSLVQIIYTRLYVFGNALVNLALPLKPALSDATPLIPRMHIYVLVAGVVILLYLGLIQARQKYHIWKVFGAMFLISLLPALNLLPLPRFNSPHYAYFALPLSGLAIILIIRSVFRPYLRKCLGIVAFVWLVICTVSTYTAGPRFHDDVSLFTPEVQHDPYFREGNYYLGYYYWQHVDYAHAERYFSSALLNDHTHAAFVDTASLYINYGGLMLYKNNLDSAEQYITMAQQSAPVSMKPLIIYNLALVAAKKTDYPKVISLLSARGIQWNRPEPLLLLADTQYRLGLKQEAIATLKKAEPFMTPVQKQQVDTLIHSLQ